MLVILCLFYPSIIIIIIIIIIFIIIITIIIIIITIIIIIIIIYKGKSKISHATWAAIQLHSHRYVLMPSLWVETDVTRSDGWV